MARASSRVPSLRMPRHAPPSARAEEANPALGGKGSIGEDEQYDRLYLCLALIAANVNCLFQCVGWRCANFKMRHLFQSVDQKRTDHDFMNRALFVHSKCAALYVIIRRQCAHSFAAQNKIVLCVRKTKTVILYARNRDYSFVNCAIHDLCRAKKIT